MNIQLVMQFIKYRKFRDLKSQIKTLFLHAPILLIPILMRATVKFLQVLFLCIKNEKNECEGRQEKW